MGAASSRNRYQQGVSLLETLLALFVIGIAILAFGALTQYIQVNTRVKVKAAAYNVAVEELEAIRTMGYTAIAGRNDTLPQPFMNVAIPAGDWKVANLAGAPSAPNAYDVAHQGPSATGVTGLAVIPSPKNFETQLTAFTFETQVRIASDSPRTDWGAGIYFRYQDENNYFRYMISDDRIELSRKTKDAAGTVATSTLYNGSPTINPDTWYRLRVRFTGDATNNIRVYLNGVEIYTGTYFTPTQGTVGLFAHNSAHAYFDDVKIATSTANVPPAEPTWDTTWNFDTGETVGTEAAGWARFGLNHLPNPTPTVANDNGTILITNYAGNTNLKHVVVTVTYTLINSTQTLRLETLMSRYGTAK